MFMDKQFLLFIVIIFINKASLSSSSSASNIVDIESPSLFANPNIDDSNSRNAVKIKEIKWPNGIVPFTFIPNTFKSEEITMILNSMEIFTKKSCVQFVPKLSTHVEHIEFRKSSEMCGSSIGYRANMSKPLDVTLSPVCLAIPGAIQHELLHVLGLFHEQSRSDRDQYVDILWENIDEKYIQNFWKISDKIVETFNLPYDYKSLMHYPSDAFARKGKNVTIVSKKNPSMRLGQSDGPTFYDMEKIRRMYNC